jgi:hypothetical protein
MFGRGGATTGRAAAGFVGVLSLIVAAGAVRRGSSITKLDADLGDKFAAGPLIFANSALLPASSTKI